ncbi:protein of unknown function [Alteribacillus persepolensis]|uniref:Uncharacterized protein n=1 Tax=Alteribacillus persepolensis TaxID=568899 RepID=A0A1G8IAA8_9BACI|nr:DUF4355 domain-containing protein [Alteribacillus persepolensis]SDI15777.1 protein of unknown function [Alteribacillus persepolensis]
MLKLNLQYFAEEGEGNTDNQQDEGNQEGGDDNSITLSKEELEKEKQREADRRVQQALEKERQKLKEQMQQEIERERREAEELAKLSEKERQQKEFEQQQQKFEEEKKKFYRERLKLQAEQDLHERQLPTSIAPYLLADDAEKTLEVIKEVEVKWKEALEDEVKKRLATDKPNVGSTKMKGATSSLAELAKEANIRK